jgi:ABC-type bacteriocin/lantibiotic exporter with double-glycine peptidase domain
MLLLGVVMSAPGRSTSTGFLRTLACLAALIILLTTGGRLWWRLVSETPWHNTPDSSGGLKQSTGWTCSPAVAAMLLHHHGVATSEGEMAYLANTSYLGTDVRSIAWAISEKGRPHGLTAHVEGADYASCLARPTPFLAWIHVPGLGGHAICIVHAGADTVDVIDPRFGHRQKLERAQVQPIWDNRIVVVQAGPGK